MHGTSQVIMTVSLCSFAAEYRLDIKKGSSANTTTSTTSFDDSQVVDHKGRIYQKAQALFDIKQYIQAESTYPYNDTCSWRFSFFPVVFVQQ